MQQCSSKSEGYFFFKLGSLKQPNALEVPLSTNKGGDTSPKGLF